MTGTKIDQPFITIYATHSGYAIASFKPDIRHNKLKLVDLQSDDLATDNRIIEAMKKYFPHREKWEPRHDNPEYIFINSACDVGKKLEDLAIGIGTVEIDFDKCLYRLKSDLVDGLLLIPEELKGEINMYLGEASIDIIDRSLLALASGCQCYTHKPEVESSAYAMLSKWSGV